jgi:3-oxoacyl-[acyl-carrier-protein] synthase-3
MQLHEREAAGQGQDSAEKMTMAPETSSRQIARNQRPREPVHSVAALRKGMSLMISFPYVVKGIATQIGRVISISEWAEQTRVPHRHEPGAHLTGEAVERMIGVRSKSWDPERFRTIDRVRRVAGLAIESSGLQRTAIDAAIVVTCTPYELMLDQDAFRLLRELGLREDIAPIQMGAGCAGFARACAVAAKLAADNVLVVTYSAVSPLMILPDGRVNPHYLANTVHPLGRQLWASAALFSDGAAAVVLSRREGLGSVCLYSRDTQRLKDPEALDPLVHYLGGGVASPPGAPEAPALSCYGMKAPAVKRYYMEGMLRNHEELRAHRPGYDDEVRRIYTHQASPALVNGFLGTVGFDTSKVGVNVEAYGNLVTPSTLRILHEDIAARRIDRGDEFCISVVGAGPERGAVLAKVDVAMAPPLGD